MRLYGLACACGADELLAVRPGQEAMASVHTIWGEQVDPATDATPDAAWCAACWQIAFGISSEGVSCRTR